LRGRRQPESGDLGPRGVSRRGAGRCSPCQSGLSVQCGLPREQIDGSILDYFTKALLDADATLAQLRATEGARRGEVILQREQAEGEWRRLAGERDRAERDYRAGDLPTRRYDELCKKIAEEQAVAAAQVEQLRARDRASFIEHVRGAENLDGVRAALLTRFDRFVLHRKMVTRHLARGAEQPLDRLTAGSEYYIESFVRAEAWPDALLGFSVEEESGAEWVAPIMRKVPLAMLGNTQSSSSPSQ
jgi:hypothetical protein